MERVWPGGGTPPDPRECAPPLDFDLPGLPDWPGMRAGHRLRALRRHPLSMELPRNRVLAWTALAGEDDQQAFGQDLAMLGVGLDTGGQLHQVAGLMGVTAWLETVLSWPRRLIAPAGLPAGQASPPAVPAAGPEGPAAGPASRGGHPGGVMGQMSSPGEQVEHVATGG
jgi:hypothetical protein